MLLEHVPACEMGLPFMSTVLGLEFMENWN